MSEAVLRLVEKGSMDKQKALESALSQIERAFGKSIEEVFARFDAEPMASASIAQVHFAQLKDGREVAVKVLRPGMLAIIDDDLALMRWLAGWVPISSNLRMLAFIEGGAGIMGQIFSIFDLRT